MSFQRLHAIEQTHAEALASAIVLGNERARHLPRRGDEIGTPDRGQGPRRADTIVRKRRILRHLADLELQRATVIDHPPPMRFQPGQHAAGVFGGKAMPARVRGCAHAVIEHAFRRHGGQVQQALAQEPFLEGQVELGESGTQRLDPGGVLVDDVDFRHRGLIGSRLSPIGQRSPNKIPTLPRRRAQGKDRYGTCL